MTTLYNCHHDGDQYRITKFDSLGNVESSYLCSHSECECPAGFRPSCRHREMLPKFISREAVNSFWFYDYDRGGWVTNEQPALPAGVTMLSLNEPEELHNTIADAIGEPSAKLRRRI